MYKILGVYVCIGTPLPVANLLTADSEDARNPLLAIVCREAEHRQNIVLHAVVKMVETVVS